MIVTIRRTFASSHMTMGQMSCGEKMCSTIEPPLSLFQKKGSVAAPEGQYPIYISGEELCVEVPHIGKLVLGSDIQMGLGGSGASLYKRKQTQELFFPAIAEAIGVGSDVLLDVVNPR